MATEPTHPLSSFTPPRQGDRWSWVSSMGMVDQSKETLACRRKKPNRKRKRKKEEIGPSLFPTPWSFQLLTENLSIIQLRVWCTHISWSLAALLGSRLVYPTACFCSLPYLIGLSIKLTNAIMESISFPSPAPAPLCFFSLPSFQLLKLVPLFYLKSQIQVAARLIWQ